MTVKPGALTMPSGAIAAPHIDVSLFARGMLHRCVTRWYFADEVDANAADPVLGRVPAERRETLLAEPVDGVYEIDIRLQGDGEKVVLDLDGLHHLFDARAGAYPQASLDVGAP